MAGTDSPPPDVTSQGDGLSAGLALARYSHLRWNAPLSTGHAEALLGYLHVGGGDDILDLGCGWGELLLRAVAGGAVGPAGARHAIGVDTDESQLERGRALASERGLDSRVTFLHGRAEAWDQTADRIICVGAAHAWGGAEAALTHLFDLTRPGGRLLFGNGCWERPPAEAASALFGTRVLLLSELVGRATAQGWRTLSLTLADQREWDEFESGWRAGREEWLLANPGHSSAAMVRAELDARLTEYLTIYRGVLGFCYLVLGR